MSLFLIYFGTRRRHPHLAHHNVVFGPRYRELLDDIFVKGMLADDFSLYLHAPTVTDPSLAPEGCEAFYVLSPVPHLGIGDVDWRTEGPRYADRILSYLEARYIPNLKADLVTQRIFTPLDFKETLHAHQGSAFSLEPVLTQSAWFRVHNRDSRIGGLYFVGAGTHPGAGVPGVVNSAKATAGLMVEDLGRARGRRAMTTAGVAAPDEAIRAGSKSFALASRLFEPATRSLVWDLYAWCRHCDDVTDGQVSGHGHEVVADRAARVGGTETPVRSSPGLGTAAGGTAFAGLARVVAATGLPRRHVPRPPRRVRDGRRRPLLRDARRHAVLLLSRRRGGRVDDGVDHGRARRGHAAARLRSGHGLPAHQHRARRE